MSDRDWKAISKGDVYRLFYDRITECLDWADDESTDKKEVTNFIEGCWEMARRILELFDAPTDKDTICDRCNMLQHCLEVGDMVDVRTMTDVRHHFKEAAGYKCPKDRQYDEDNEDDDEDGSHV